MCGTSVAHAQSLWGGLRLPGGATAARRVIVSTTSDGHPDAEWLLDFTRGAYALQAPDAAVAPFLDYIEFIEKVEAAMHRWPAGVALPSTSMSDADKEGLKRYIELLGLRVRRVQNHDVVEPDDSDTAQRYAHWLQASGVDVTAVAKALTAGQSAKIAVVDGTVPLPLPDYWNRALKTNAPTIQAIAGDRSLALLYYGLMSLDDETLRFLESDAQLLEHLRSDSAAVFSQFGRSVHVQRGAIDVPGDADAVPLWQSLVDASPRQPDRFIRQLLDRDDGRLAMFFDLVSHLTLNQQRFALGPPSPKRGHADQDVRDVYEWFKRDTPTWSIANRPFSRPAFDPSVVLAAIEPTSEGFAGPVWWPGLLDVVMNDRTWPDKPERILKSLRDQPANAAWLLDWVFDGRADAPRRWQTFRYLQRNFAQAPKTAAPSIDSALRAFHDMPALALSLERMGVHDPVSIESIVRAAHEVTTSASRDDAVPVIGRWQSARSLLEQIQRRRRQTPESLAPLLQSLATMPAKPDDAVGFIAEWLTTKLLPFVFGPAVVPDHVESAAVSAFVASQVPRPHVTWEGLEYVLDDRPLVAKNVAAIRALQSLPKLDDLVALAGIRARLNGPLSTLDELKQIEADLAGLQSALALLPTHEGSPPDIVNDFRDSLSNLQHIKQAKDVKRATRELKVVDRALDALTDAVVPPLVYALAVSPTNQPANVFAAAWTTHALTPKGVDDPRVWSDLIWQLANSEERPGGGLMLRGSMLGLDIALADSQLRHASAPDPALHGQLDDNDRFALTQALVIRNDDERPSDADVSAVIAGLAAGRQQASQWSAPGAPFTDMAQQLRRTTLDEWQVNLLLWRFGNEGRAAVDGLGAQTLWEIGAHAPVLPKIFGGSARPIDGCWCTETFSDRGAILRAHGFGLAATVQSDLILRLAEFVSAARLPEDVVPYLLPAATQDWLDHIVQDGAQDWEALGAWPVRIKASRLDDYLLQLVSLGVLSPPR